MNFSAKESILLKNIMFLDNSYKFHRGTILIKRGKIDDIIFGDIEIHGDIEIDGENCIALPGLIDVHIHGAYGTDSMDGNYDSINNISKFLARNGITGFLATTMTDTKENIENAFMTISLADKKGVDGAGILGINMEGPYLNPKAKGAHVAELLSLPDIAEFEYLNKKADELVRYVTVAPEIDGADKFIKYLSSNYIVASVGHTVASYEEMENGRKNGITHATHLFNAMPQLHHRNPGATCSILQSNVVAEIISDGIHVNPAMIKMAYALKGAENICLISDSMMAAGLEDGKYVLGGQTVIVDNGKATLENGTIAGGTSNIMQGVRNLVEWGFKLEEAVKMASYVPAKTLNLEKTKGSICKSKDADIIVVDKKLDLWLTIVNGKIVYKKS